MSFFASWVARRVRGRVAAGWLGVHAAETVVHGALACAGRDQRPGVHLLPPAPLPVETATLRNWREGAARALRANVVLRSSEYRVLPIDPPDLPPDDLREAARLQVADALDFPVEDAAIDLLSVPTHQASQRSQRFVVAAPNEPILRWLRQCQQAELRLGAVDIPELAMRNLSVLAAGDSAHAFLHIGLRSTRLALIWRRELCSFRQLDISGTQLASAGEYEREPLLERLALEIQRTVDAFSRQFSGIELEALWLTSVHQPEAVADALATLISQRVRHFAVEQYVDVQGGVAVVDVARGHDHLLAIGAALRQELH